MLRSFVRSLALVLAMGAAQLAHAAEGGSQTAAAAPADPEKEFVARVLGATEDVWHAVFKQVGKRYIEPKLVLFTDTTLGACGRQQASSGPEYCEADRRVYLDLAFFRTLHEDYGAPGDFARAYVIAHEIGHHVQNLLGILAKAGEIEAKLDQRQRNAFSVRVELQADCLAGVWAGLADKMWPGMIEPGDVEKGLAAAAAVGDNRLQNAASGTVVPESFTHGTSEQRMRWLRRGIDSAEIQACDTFNAKEL
jgi:predicted metalloprotease